MGVHLDKRGATLAPATGLRGPQPQLRGCRSTDDPATLAEEVDRLGVRKWPARVILGTDDYHVLQVTRPGVPDAEMTQALRWRINDLVSDPVDELVVDWFDLPGQKAPADEQAVMVVAARRAAVVEALEHVRRAGLKPDSVGIVQLALRNLMPVGPDARQGIALLVLGRESSLINLGRGAGLYLSRDVEIGTVGLRAEAADAPGVVPNVFMDISLEIQRSLDYYDAYFSDPPMRRLWIAGAGGAVIQRLADYLDENLALDARLLDPAELGVGIEAETALDDRCLVALGGALHGRPEVTE